MSAFTDIVEMIRATEAELERATHRLADGEVSFAIELSIGSLRNRLAELHQEFEEITAAQEIDVCKYRLQSESTGTYPIAALGKALSNFQELFTVLHDSIRRKRPRHRATASRESIAATRLDFGFSFSGSLGFVFTTPESTSAESATDKELLDEAMSTLISLTETTTTDGVSDFAEKYGAAPVRLAYLWAEAHARAGLSLDLEWKRDNAVVLRTSAQVPKLARLTNLIAATSDIRKEQLRVFGELVGVDIINRTFRLRVDGKQEYRGILHTAFRPPVPLVVGNNYTAEMDIETKINYASGKEQRRILLLSLTAFTSRLPHNALPPPSA